MKKKFQPFQYQLNLNSTEEKSPGKIKRENRQKTISIMITPQTDIYLTAKKVCVDNNLRENLVLILAASISEEIEKQLEVQRTNHTYDSLSSISSQQSRTKSFKNRFCESLQNSHCNSVENQSTFRNSQFVVDPPSLGNSDEEEYSFRPATYLKMLDLTDDEENQSILVNNFSVNQSYLTTDSLKSKQAGKILVKKNFQKKQPITFDNLSQIQKGLQLKLKQERKKSVEKNKSICKPQTSPISKKMLQNIQQYNSAATIFVQISANKQKSRNQSPTFARNSKSKSFLEASRFSKYNIRKQQSDKQNDLSIYERGMIFRKMSQQKLLKMKEQQIVDQMKSCTFKPKLNQREKSQKSKILSASTYGKLI